MVEAIAPAGAVSGLRSHGLQVPVALSAWTALVVVAAVWGRSLAASSDIAINAAPLFGRFDARFSMKVLPLVLLAVAAVAYLAKLAANMRFGRLLAVCWIAALLWAVALSFVEGPEGFLGALQNPRDYLAAIPLVDSPLSFVSGFIENIASFPLHVQAHPPATVLFLLSLDGLGLTGAGWAAVSMVVAGASSPAAALLTVRELASERCARACAPFLVLCPAAIWIATSADALYLAASAWGITLFVLATGRRDVIGDILAGCAGLVLGASLFFSYGVAPLGLIVAAVAVARRRLRPLLVAGAGVAAVAAVFAALGFWWPEGLGATIERYEAGVARHRPYAFFLVNNLAAFAIAVGPAIAVAVTRLRDRRLWVIVGAALLAIAVADLSGLSKGEVERIWLPFVPWVVVASAALENSKPWLILQAGTAVAVAVLVMTPW